MRGGITWEIYAQFFFGEPKTTLKAAYLFLKQPLLKCKYLGVFDTHMSVNEITSVPLSHLGWDNMQGQYKLGQSASWKKGNYLK